MVAVRLRVCYFAFVVLVAAALSMPMGLFSVAEASEPRQAEEVVLRMGFLQEVDSLNPYLGLNAVSYIFYGLVYDCLQGVGNDLESTPNLAREWWVVPETDPQMVITGEPYGSVWQYNLTYNTYWTDGEPFTADDVVWNINLHAYNYVDLWAFQPYAYFMCYAEKVDYFTARIHYYDRMTGLPMPVAYGSQVQIPMLPKHILESFAPWELGFSWNGTPIVGTGPFMANDQIMNEWISGDRLTLLRNPNYHGSADYGQVVHFDKIRLNFYMESTAMSLALQSGEIDFAMVPPIVYYDLKNRIDSGMLKNVTVFNGIRPDNYFIYIMTNMNLAGPNPARLDPSLRHALAMATNKSYIVNQFYYGLADEGSTLVSPANEFWHYEPTADERFEWDLTAAAALLEASGYIDTNADGIRECTASSRPVQEGWVVEGKPLVFEMLVRREHPEEKDIVQYLKAEWAKIGVVINYEIMDEAMLATRVYSYSYDMAVWEWSADPDPNYILFTQSRAAWNGWGDTMYSSPAYEENYTASIRTIDPGARKVHVDACQRIHYLDCPYIILSYPDHTVAWRTDTFSGWGDWSEDPGRSVLCSWSGNPLYFDLMRPSAFDRVTVDPAAVVMRPMETRTFTAQAYDGAGTPVPDMEYSWSVGGMVAGEYSLSSSSDQVVSFRPLVEGTAWLNASATLENTTKTGTAVVISSFTLTDREVEYRWYDMFNVPFGEWWDRRAEVAAVDIPLSHEYPYLFQWNGAPPGNSRIYSNMRLDVTARNLPEVNMAENPQFLPRHGMGSGGNAVIDWYMQYLTSEEMKRFPNATAGWNDGWITSLNGTVTLDEDAALSVLLGLTPEGYDNFTAWWTVNKNAVKTDFADWFKHEAGKDRLDIYPMYEYVFTFLGWNIDAVKVGEEVVLTYDLVTWGMEALMTRWLHEAFMPTEWYFEDMDFHATIGPATADIDIETAVAYAVYAWETVDEPHSACWVWEAKMGDYVVAGPPENKESLYNAYADKTLLNKAPGSLWYDNMMTYDYTPGAWNLSENERLTFEWPSGDQMFKVHVGPDEVLNITAPMLVTYAEPMETDGPELLPGSVSVDNIAREVTFVGPIDMWNWSRDLDEAAHSQLSGEWDRVGLLPRGVPYIEFSAWQGEPPVLLEISVLPQEPFVDVPANITVSALDLSGQKVGSYRGTVTFSSDCSSEATLPADYVFTAGDAGTHTFTAGLTFHATGWYLLTCSDTLSASVFSANLMVKVLEPPPAPPDYPPVAFAGQDVTVEVGELVVLNGSGSYDDIGLVNWTWRYPYDDDWVEAYGESVNCTFMIEGVYEINLTVEDMAGQTDWDIVVVTVVAPEPDEDDGLPSYALFAAGSAVVVVAAVLLLYFLLRMRRPKG